MVDRDPNTIKQEIDQTRDQLAATIDSLAERANPRRLADDAKTRVIAFLRKPIVTVSLVGIGSVVVVVVIHKIRNRCPTRSYRWETHCSAP